MANRKLWLGITALVLGLFIWGCGEIIMGEKNKDNEDGEDGGDGEIQKSAIELSANIWSDGALTEGAEQWFKFTAAAGTQYLHVIFGTMDSMDVQLYTDTDSALGNAIGLYGDIKYTSLTVTAGKVYYIKVTPGTKGYYDSSTTGTYRITFNSVQFRPGTFDKAATLTPDVWENGTILDGEEQWFKFTATAGTQYLHIIFGTMNNIDVQLYSEVGDALGNSMGLHDDTKYKSFIVAIGQVYYVRVTPGTEYSWRSDSITGTYRIAINISTVAPGEE